MFAALTGAAAVYAVITAVLFLPDSFDINYGGVAEAIAGGLAVAVAVALLLAITFGLCAAVLAFAVVSFVMLLRVCRGGRCGKKTVATLFVSLAGTVAALLAGMFLCGTNASPALLSAGVVLVVVAAAEGALRVAYAVRAMRALKAPASDEKKIEGGICRK